MNEELTTVPIKVVYVLAQVIDAILNETKVNEDGTKSIKERKLPFRLRYRLVRDLEPLKKYIKEAEETKLYCLAQYGELSLDGKNIELKTEESKKKYYEKIAELLNIEVSFHIMTCEPEDLDEIKGITNEELSNKMIEVLISYLINDRPRLDDLAKTIEFNFKENEENSKDGK